MDNNKKKLIMFAGFGEFHLYTHCNLLLHEIKKRGLFDEIIIAAPSAAIGCFSHADKIITLAPDYLDSLGGSYPLVLEIKNVFQRIDQKRRTMTPIEQSTLGDIISKNIANFIDHTRNFTEFDKIVGDYIEKNSLYDGASIYYFHNFNGIYDVGTRDQTLEVCKFHNISNFPCKEPLKDCDEHSKSFKSIANYSHCEHGGAGSKLHVAGLGGAAAEFRDYKWMREWIQNNTLKCSEATFNKIKDKYQHLFNNKTFVITTRNFHSKNPSANTKKVYPHTEELIKYLTENGIRIINFGLPPADYTINNENYIEINDRLNQEELIAFISLGNGLLRHLWAGNFEAHLCSHYDLFALTPSYSVQERGVHILGGRKKNDQIKTYEMYEEYEQKNWTAIYETLINHSKSSLKFLQKEIEVVFIDNQNNTEDEQ